MSDFEFKDLALPMVALGVPVIRLKHKSKEPLDKRWNELATTNPDVIEKWNQATPSINCGCVATPDGVLIFETDQKGVVERYEAETEQKFPETFTVESGKQGFHYYFTQTPRTREIGNISQKVLLFGSVRQNNAYVVSAFSVHPETGRQYTIHTDVPIVPMPDALINWINDQRTSALTSKLEKNSASIPTAPSGLEITINPDLIITANRDDTLASIAGSLRAHNCNYDEIFDTLAALVAHHMIQPKGDRKTHQDAERIASSYSRDSYAPPPEPFAPTVLINGKAPEQAPLVGLRITKDATVEEIRKMPQSEKERLTAEAHAEFDKSVQEFAELQELCDQEQTVVPNPYPNDAWEGTPYLEFARLCRSEGDPKFQNYLPTEFGINALMTVVGAICGHRICPDFDNMDARFYTVLLTPRGGSGKGTIFKFTKDLFAGTGLLYASNRVFRSVGTFVDDFASARGLIESFFDHSSILQVYEELSTPFEKFGIAGSGTSFKDLNLRLFDSTDPQNSRKGGIKVPEDAPTHIHNSILGSTTTEKGRWDEMFSSSNDDTLRQRLNIIPSEEDRRVCAIKQPDFTELRKVLLPRIGLLNSYKLVWSYSPEAWEMLTSWYTWIDDQARDAGNNDEREALGRIQVHIHRVIGHLALWLAPLPPSIAFQTQRLFEFESDWSDWVDSLLEESDEDKLWNVVVTADWMRRAIRIAEHQIRTRRDHTPPEGLTPVALCENLIKKHMSRKKTLRWFSLVRVANLDKYGLDIRIKALFNAQRERAIRIDANPEDKNNQSEWVITWLGRGWNVSWKETRGGKRKGAGRKAKGSSEHEPVE